MAFSFSHKFEWRHPGELFHFDCDAVPSSSSSSYSWFNNFYLFFFVLLSTLSIIKSDMNPMCVLSFSSNIFLNFGNQYEPVSLSWRCFWISHFNIQAPCYFSCSLPVLSVPWAQTKRFPRGTLKGSEKSHSFLMSTTAPSSQPDCNLFTFSACNINKFMIMFSQYFLWY